MRTPTVLGEISDSHSGKYDDLSSEILRPVVLQKLMDISEVLTTSIMRAVMMAETVSTFEMSVSFY